MYNSYLTGIDPLIGRSGHSLLKWDTETPTGQIMVNLSDSDSKVGAKAAGLLGSRPEKGVSDRRLQVVRADKHLKVFLLCINLFLVYYESNKDAWSRSRSG
jgi:hypothetical protein